MTSVMAASDTRAAKALLAVCAAPDADHAKMLSQLTDSGWQNVATLAIQTRAVGLMARSIKRCGDVGIVGKDAKDQIAGQAQHDALTVLSQGEASKRVADVLRSQGLEGIALKGFSLAFRDYPDPALRPLRDIDLLFTADDALKAQQTLLEHPSFKPRAGVAQYGLDYGHQLPEIEEISSGLVIELHHRINARGWDQEPRLVEMLRREAETLTLLGAKMLAPSPHCNFLHLVEHAAVHHLFTNGPLVLSDFHYLASNHEFDWGELLADAQSLGLGRALLLLAHIAHEAGARWVPDDWLGLDPVRRELSTQAREALFDTREQTEQIAMMQRLADKSEGISGAGGAARRMLRPSANQLSRLSGHHSDSPLRWLGYPAWLLEKGKRYLTATNDADNASAIHGRMQLRRWIKGE
ncbi:MAG: nucleotidyltransferase family protein [Erythrobacter sp.]